MGGGGNVCHGDRRMSGEEGGLSGRRAESGVQHKEFVLKSPVYLRSSQSEWSSGYETN